MAASKGCTFITANASHLLSPYVGDSEKRIAALFHAARLAQPTILFIDEIGKQYHGVCFDVKVYLICTNYQNIEPETG